MNCDVLLQLVAKAQASPSVHNVQPARWQIDGDSIFLIEDCSRRLVVGDPQGNDAAISLGAAAEGLYLAASQAGYSLVEEDSNLPAMPDPFQAIRRFRTVADSTPDPLAIQLERRSSWRGSFLAPDASDRLALAGLTGLDATVVCDAEQLRRLARLYDQASYGFIRRRSFRGELRRWMRLSASHPDWSRDGLNAHAMALSRIEAFGADFVMGVAFPLLDFLRLAPSLLAEGQKVAGAAGLVLFHRPIGEDPFVSGRRFHRLWLEIEALGMGAAVLAALADDKAIAERISTDFALPDGRRLVSAFRVGRRDGTPQARARLPLKEVLV
jgi:nitroreductase